MNLRDLVLAGADVRLEPDHYTHGSICMAGSDRGDGVGHGQAHGSGSEWGIRLGDTTGDGSGGGGGCGFGIGEAVEAGETRYVVRGRTP